MASDSDISGGDKNKKDREFSLGVVYGLAAYGLWGILPVYWKQIQHVPAFEILANRFLWSAVFVFLLLLVTGSINKFKAEARDTFSTYRGGLRMVLAGIMVFFNWGIYIWAVEDGRILETALGYYINPMVTVCLGVIFLRERMNILEWIACALAVGGILSMVVNTGYLPWVAVAEPVTFATYGFLKKCISVSPFTSTLLETLILLPFMGGYLVYLWINGTNAFQIYDWTTALYLMGCGIITATPLLFFAGSAQRVPLNVLGFMQYISPSISMSVGVFIYHEVFTFAHMVTFGMIWAGLVFFTYSQFCRARK